MLNNKIVKRVKKMIAEEYPEFKNIEPDITAHTIKPQTEVYQKLSIGLPKQRRKIYRMKFTKTVRAEDNAVLQRILTVTLNSHGDIYKITESK